ncbi:hypothetical protein L6164_001324 [Bauhinia variegata]|uniref:Uncharacterized protein n=1 Tax=Bauhinia variegata TaxID=167791 RepID=A0ACB9Q9G2_BAUVA|nr:hypothetical protein L6164_001324 [Bauhinia variegata]
MQIKQILKGADANEENNPQLAVWVKQVRGVAFGIEDVLDEFSLHFAGLNGEQDRCSAFKKIASSYKKWKANYQIGSELQSIKTRVKHISESHQSIVKGQFKSHALVRVSETLKQEEVLRELIQQLSRNSHRLKETLKELLQNRRYLIVLDDVWKREDWDQLKLAMPRNNCGSRIIITTRITGVARYSTTEYQEDHLVEPTSLVRMWISEGFVEKKEGRTIEEVAESYFHELHNRTCCIHDFLRETILPKSYSGSALFDGSTMSKLFSCGLKLLKVLDLRGSQLEIFPPEISELFLFKIRALNLCGMSSVTDGGRHVLTTYTSPTVIFDWKTSQVTMFASQEEWKSWVENDFADVVNSYDALLMHIRSSAVASEPLSSANLHTPSTGVQPFDPLHDDKPVPQNPSDGHGVDEIDDSSDAS